MVRAPGEILMGHTEMGNHLNAHQLLNEDTACAISYDGIPTVQQEKGTLSGTCHNMNDPHKYYAQEKKLNTETTYCSVLFIQNIQKSKATETESALVVGAGAGSKSA